MAELEFHSFIHWVLQYSWALLAAALGEAGSPHLREQDPKVNINKWQFRETSSVQAHHWVTQNRGGLCSLSPGLLVVHACDGMPDNLVFVWWLFVLSLFLLLAMQKSSIDFLRWCSSWRCFSLWLNPTVLLQIIHWHLVEAKLDFLTLFLSILTAPLLCVQDPPSFVKCLQLLKRGVLSPFSQPSPQEEGEDEVIQALF